LPADSPIPPWRLRQAARLVCRGGIVAYPTESVFGLGCDPFDPQAVARLLDLKQRPVSQGLILIADRFARLEPLLAPLPPARRSQILATWPGPTTWVIPASERVPAWLLGPEGDLAVRVTAHPLAAALCAACGQALVSTSANRHGRPPARSPLQVRRRCGAAVDLILHGETLGLARPTRIQHALSGRLLRA